MNFLSSNILNIFVTCLFAYGISFVPEKLLMLVFKVASIVLSIFIVYSYVFDVGEVVYVFKHYKRAFFIFDDGINITLIFLYYILLANKNIIYSQLLLIAFLMAFGKMATILLILCLLILLVCNQSRKEIFKRFVITFIVAIISVYAASNLSYYLYDNYEVMKKGQSVISEELVLLEEGSAKVNHAENHCKTCFITWPLQIRLMSFVAGIWMIQQGGFSGKNAIKSPIEFADIFYNKNPYGVNDYFNLTYEEWLHVQSVHNAFIGIGASYGPGALLLLLSFVLYVAVKGWRFKSESYFYAACLAYFLTIIIFNQSQQYIHPYNLELIVLAFCGSYILNKSHGIGLFKK